MFYLVVGAHCIQVLNKMEITHTVCGVQEVKLKRRIVELEKDVHGFDQRCALLALEKTVAEKIRYALEAKVDFLTQENEGLMTQNESLERDVCDRDTLLEEARVEAEAVRRDRDWLLQVGFMHIMDKLIEHPKFTIVVSRIRHAAFIASEESDSSGLKVEVDYGSYEPNASDSRSSHTTSLNDGPACVCHYGSCFPHGLRAFGHGGYAIALRSG